MNATLTYNEVANDYDLWIQFLPADRDFPDRFFFSMPEQKLERLRRTFGPSGRLFRIGTVVTVTRKTEGTRVGEIGVVAGYNRTGYVVVCEDADLYGHETALPADFIEPVGVEALMAEIRSVRNRLASLELKPSPRRYYARDLGRLRREYKRLYEIYFVRFCKWDIEDVDSDVADDLFAPYWENCNLDDERVREGLGL